MDARLLQHARPLDVVLLVEARFQFHQHRDLLAASVGLHQRLHDLRVSPATDAIEGLLDGEHLWIARRRLDEVGDGAKGVVRVVQQHVAVADRLERVLAAAQLHWDTRDEWWIFQSSHSLRSANPTPEPVSGSEDWVETRTTPLEHVEFTPPPPPSKLSAVLSSTS